MIQKFLVLFAILIPVGYASLDLLSVLPLLLIEARTAYATKAAAIFLIVAMAPFLPLVAVSISGFTGWRMAGWLAAILAILAGIFGILLSFLYLVSIDGGLLIPFVHGMTLSAAVAGAILALARTNLAQWAALFLMTAPAIVAMWSLAVAGTIAVSARQISDGRPYCLARPPERKPINTLAELRGLAFYTMTEWDFHGVLVVQNDAGLTAYNWSPRRMRFDPVLRPGILFTDPRSECTPEPNFLGSRPVISP